MLTTNVQKTLTLTFECKAFKKNPLEINTAIFELRMKWCENPLTPGKTSNTGILSQFNEGKFQYYDVGAEVLVFNSAIPTETVLWKNKVLTGQQPYIDVQEMNFLNQTAATP